MLLSCCKKNSAVLLLSSFKHDCGLDIRPLWKNQWEMQKNSGSDSIYAVFLGQGDSLLATTIFQKEAPLWQ